MVLSNSKSMHTRIQNSEISVSQSKVYKYSTVHSNRIESNSINSTNRNRSFLQLFISEMIHAKQWHYSLHRDFQQLHTIHSTRRNPRDSSSTNSTCRRQGDLLSSLQRPTRHSRHSSHSSPTGITTRSSTSSTIQYLPVLSSASRDFHLFQQFYTSIGFHQKLH